MKNNNNKIQIARPITVDSWLGSHTYDVRVSVRTLEISKRKKKKNIHKKETRRTSRQSLCHFNVCPNQCMCDCECQLHTYVAEHFELFYRWADLLLITECFFWVHVLFRMLFWIQFPMNFFFFFKWAISSNDIIICMGLGKFKIVSARPLDVEKCYSILISIELIATCARCPYQLISFCVGILLPSWQYWSSMRDGKWVGDLFARHHYYYYKNFIDTNVCNFPFRLLIHTLAKLRAAFKLNSMIVKYDKRMFSFFFRLTFPFVS